MDGIDIYHARTDAAHEHMRGVLGRDELERAQTYARKADRDRFLLGAATLRIAAGERLGLPPADVGVRRNCVDCGRSHGRPVLMDSALGCSVSHAGPHVVVALTERRDVGIDLEMIHGRADRWRALIRHVVGPKERFPRNAAGFLRIWTRKEALLKLSGEGLRRPMISLALTFPTDAQARGDEHGESTALAGPPSLAGAVVRDLDLGGDVVAAVATFGAPPAVRVMRMRPDSHTDATT